MTSTLVLNADGNPVSYIPLSVIDWQSSISYIVLDRADILEWYDNWIVRSANWSTHVPAVIMLRTFEKKKNYIRYSKSNVFLRDNYTCQYCGRKMNKKECTLDHVQPISRGGRSIFENTVCSCSKCNATKGNSNKLKPIKKPIRPNYHQLAEIRKQHPYEIKHPSWNLYIRFES
jgi:5-methylcytosine-specific restriction endonuclease McrA